MATSEAALKLAKKICAARESGDNGRCMRYLRRLQDWDTEGLALEGTPIAYQVKELCAHSDDAVAELARKVYVGWRKRGQYAEGWQQGSRLKRKADILSAEQAGTGPADHQAVKRPATEAHTAASRPQPRMSTLKATVGTLSAQRPRLYTQPPPRAMPEGDGLRQTQKKGIPGSSTARPVIGALQEAYNDPLLESERASAAAHVKELRHRAYGPNQKKKVAYNYKLQLDKYVSLDDVMVEEDATAKRNQKTIRMFKTTTTLVELCLKTMENNIDCISELRYLPVKLLDRLLSKCTPAQLARLESANSYLLEDTDIYWERHCNKAAYNGPMPPKDGWRQLHKRQAKADKIRFQVVAQGLTQRYKELEDGKRKKEMTIIDPTNDWLRHHGVVRTPRRRAGTVQSSGPKLANMSKLQKLRNTLRKNRH